jgi:WhiB family redox-sensing transcriptional regulator
MQPSFADQPWVDQALCAQVGPDAFFPEKGAPTRDAKSVCVGCMVRVECLNYALGHGEQFGVWGGLSERERRKLYVAITCPHCGDAFVTALGLNRHLTLHHDPANPHVCLHCAQRFLYPGPLNRHIQARHQDNLKAAS